MSSRDSDEFIILEVSDVQIRTNLILGNKNTFSRANLFDYQIADGYLSVRSNLGDGAHSLKLKGHRVNHGQWVLVSLHRYDNIFTLRLEQGGGAREVTGVLGHKREIVVHPSSLYIGNNGTPNINGDFQGGALSLY